MTPFISHDRLSGMIGHIYDCALDPDLWPATMDEICRELDLRTGVVSLISLLDGRPLLAATTGFAPEWIGKVDEYADGLVELWGGPQTIHTLPLDAPAVLSQVNPRAIAEDSQDPFHIRFNQPQGFVDAIAVGISRDHQTIGTIGFNRHRDAGLIGPRETRIMHLLVPHLQRAITVSRVLDIRKIASQNMESVLNGLRIPIVLTARDLRILFANAAAEQCFSIRGGLASSAGRLQLHPASMHRALELALAKVARKSAAPVDDAAARNPFGIPLATADGHLRSVHVLPLNPHRETLPLVQDEAFALIFSPRNLVSENALNIIASLFGLTGGEKRILEQILNGLTIQETAERLAISKSTVRTHLLHIFDKTGVRRQAELVALAASFSSLAL